MPTEESRFLGVLDEMKETKGNNGVHRDSRRTAVMSNETRLRHNQIGLQRRIVRPPPAPTFSIPRRPSFISRASTVLRFISLSMLNSCYSNKLTVDFIDDDGTESMLWIFFSPIRNQIVRSVNVRVDSSERRIYPRKREFAKDGKIYARNACTWGKERWISSVALSFDSAEIRNIIKLRM